MSVWESVRAVMRETGLDLEGARLEVDRLLGAAFARIVPIGAAEGEAALEAMARFGKGFHAAQLNMGDCFAYACARTHGAALLYKGEDFSRTDARTA